MCIRDRNSIHLRRNHGDGLPGFTLIKRFTNTQNRTQTGGQCSSKLLGNQGIGLPIDGTTLGVPDENVTTGKVLEHCRTDFASEGTLCLFCLLYTSRCV